MVVVNEQHIVWKLYSGLAKRIGFVQNAYYLALVVFLLGKVLVMQGLHRNKVKCLQVIYCFL